MHGTCKEKQQDSDNNADDKHSNNTCNASTATTVKNKDND